MMNRGGGGDNGDDDDDDVIISNPIISISCLDDNILCEILSRLSVESLIRLKCVCKHWCSLIQQNSLLGYLHLSQSETRPPRLLALIPMAHINCLYEVDLFEEDRETVCHMIEFEASMLGPINGLICFTKHKGGNAVRIYNLCTRQVTPWIKTTLNLEKQEHGVEVFRHPYYQFGYDPATKEHKVICVWDIRKLKLLPERKLISFDKACEVLTVGHNSWRRINEFPQDKNFAINSVYVNGTIYWCRFHDYLNDPLKLLSMMAFDVGSEKFRIIDDVNPPPLFGRQEVELPSLLDVDGHFAILHRISTRVVKLWIFRDDKRQQSTTSNSSSSNWIEETILLTFRWTDYLHLSFQTWKDQIIVISHNKPTRFGRIFSYDRKNKIFRKLEIDKEVYFDLIHCSFFKITTSIDSLLPVQKQQQQQHHQSQPPLEN